jgi:hypothetical protein
VNTTGSIPDDPRARRPGYARGVRWTLALAMLSLLARRGVADSRLEQLAKGYEREQTSCRIHEGGIAKMLDGAMLLEQAREDGLAQDVNSLHAAHELVASYCAALAATIEFLRADPTASYKSLEKQIGDHDNHIRALRASSKKALDETEPLIQRWIPKINAARIENDKSSVHAPAPKEAAPEARAVKPEPGFAVKPAAKPEPKPDLKTDPGPDATAVSAKFPSGRAIRLPPLGAKWELRGDATTDVAEYVDGGNKTSVVAETFSGVSCAAQLARLQAKAYGREAVKEPARTGQAWLVRLSTDSPAVVACASTRTGSAMVTFDAADASHPDVSELAWTMLAALAK